MHPFFGSLVFLLVIAFGLWVTAFSWSYVLDQDSRRAVRWEEIEISRWYDIKSADCQELIYMAIVSRNAWMAAQAEKDLLRRHWNG